MIRRLIGNALDELIDEAVRRGHLAVLAAQPRAMVLETFGIDLRGGRSETYLDRASLFNQVKKTLRAR